MKRVFTILLIAVLALALLLAASFIPVLWRKAPGMQTLEGQFVRVYYQQQTAAAQDVIALAEATAAQITDALELADAPLLNLYVYDSQQKMQQKKYGMLIPLIGLSWYIGDNLGADVILTSPASTQTVHSYADILGAAPHEMVHAYVYTMNPRIRLWLTEGMALYLTNGQPFRADILQRRAIPTLQDTQTKNPIYFSNMGGYTFAHTYIAYLSEAYGWDSALSLLRTQDFEATLGKSEADVYGEWVSYLQNYKD